MKKLLLLVLLLTSTAAYAQTDAHQFANFKRYAEANAKLDKQAKNTVVFFGNSIMEHWNYLDPDYFTSHNYNCRGIGGQTSYQFLLRFRADVINNNTKTLVFMAGTNDIAENTGAYDEDRTFDNIVTMLELAKAHKIKVLMCSTLPAKGFLWRPSVTDAMPKIRALNERIKAYCKSHKIQYVDFFTLLLSEDGTELNPAYSPDGVHPNVEGYRAMEEYLKGYLK